MIAGSRTLIEDEARRPPGAPVGGGGGPLRLACAAMGTRFELVIEAGGGPGARSAGEWAIEEILRLHRVFSPFERGSELARVNALASEGPVRVTRDLLDVLEIAREAHGMTRGAFDPTIGPLMRALGFRGPAAGDRQRAQERVGMALVEIEGERIWFTRPRVELDLGAIAKGYALDVASAILRDGGVTRAFLHGGRSSLVAIGDWRVRIAKPHRGPDGALEQTGADADILLRDRAMGVSMLGGRASEDGRVGHVLDPRGGDGAAGALGAFAIGPSCALCDALSTALLVLGEGARIEHHAIERYGVWSSSGGGWIERVGVRSDRAGTMEEGSR